MMKKIYFLFALLGSTLVKAQTFPSPYCNVAFGSGVEPITLVQFSNINNSSTATVGGPAIENYLSIVGNVNAGQTYVITLKGNSDGNYTNYYRTFIDWNNDNDFDDVGESFDCGTITNSTGLDSKTTTANITIPVSQTTGNVRMRVIKKYNAYAPACNTTGYGEAEDYTLSVTAASGCTGSVTAPTASGPAQICNGAPFTLSFSGGTTGLGITHQWQRRTPSGSGNFVNIAGATTATFNTTQTATSDYRVLITCTNSNSTATSNVVTVTQQIIDCPGADLICNASTLTVNAINNDCASSTTATVDFSTLTPTPSIPIVCTGSSQTTSTTLDFWFKATVPASGNIQIVSNNTNTSWWDMAIYTIIGDPCGTPTYNLVASECVPQTHPNIILNGLTPGEILYIRMWRDQANALTTGTRTYTVCANEPPASPPSCTTNNTPANGATGVAITNVNFSWNTASGATSYDLYIGTANPPTGTPINTVNNSISLTGLTYNTTYYWYVVPKNAAGSATGCTSNITSFTTVQPPANCPTPYTYSCSSDDKITNFTLKGQTITLNNNSDCSSSGTDPNIVNYANYVDSASVTSFPDLMPGKTYSGSFTAGYFNNFLTIWIDFNNNGIFENTERILDRLISNSTDPTPFSLKIPNNVTVTGNRRLRARMVFGPTGNANPIDACSSYVFGETEDYTVNIVAPSSTPPLDISTTANPSPTTCASGGSATIGPNSNNNNEWVDLLDTDGSIIASVNANGNNLGTVRVSKFINNGALRSNNGIRYLDRNITINTSVAPTSAVNVRLYFLTSEFDALANGTAAGSPDNVDVVSDLKVSKNNDNCTNSVSALGAIINQTANSSYGSGSYVEIPVTSFSSFYLHGGFAPLSIDLLSFAANKLNQTVQVSWALDANHTAKTFELQKSEDGINFKTIKVITADPRKNNYSAIDNELLYGKNYYRLKVIGTNNATKFSNVVIVLGDKKGFGITVMPTIVKDVANLSITSSNTETVVVRIVNTQGQQVLLKNLRTVNGTINSAIDVSKLGAGIYSVVAIDNKGEVVRTKFIKE